MGLEIFRRLQRFQGGTKSVQGEDDPNHTLQTTPEEMAALYQWILKLNEQSRRRAMNEENVQHLRGYAMGTSNVGLTLFRRQLKPRKKQTK